MVAIQIPAELVGIRRKKRVEIEVGIVDIKGREDPIPGGWEIVWVQDPWTGKWERL